MLRAESSATPTDCYDARPFAEVVPCRGLTRYSSLTPLWLMSLNKLCLGIFASYRFYNENVYQHDVSGFKMINVCVCVYPENPPKAFLLTQILDEWCGTCFVTRSGVDQIPFRWRSYFQRISIPQSTLTLAQFSSSQRHQFQHFSNLLRLHNLRNNAYLQEMYPSRLFHR